MQVRGSGTAFLGRSVGLLAAEPAAIVAKPVTPAPQPQLSVVKPKTSGQASTYLPASSEPAAPATLSPGELAARQTAAGKSSTSLINELVKWRADETAGADKLEAFAQAMATQLGMSVRDARLLVNAMSRGGIDAKAIADGLKGLTSLSAAERGTLLAQWLPAARGAADAVIAWSEDAVMRAMGAPANVAAALGDLAAANVMLLDRAKSLPPGTTLADRAQTAREAAEKRATTVRGSVLLAEANKIGTGDATNEELREDFANDLAARFDIAPDKALAMVDAMRAGTQVGKMLADGFALLEKTGGASSRFAASFLHHANAALANEGAIASDPFTNWFGPTADTNLTGITQLAEFVAAMKAYYDASQGLPRA